MTTLQMEREKIKQAEIEEQKYYAKIIQANRKQKDYQAKVQQAKWNWVKFDRFISVEPRKIPWKQK